MSARNPVARLAQVLCQFLLHLGGGFEGHWIKVLVQFRQQTDAEFLEAALIPAL